MTKEQRLPPEVVEALEYADGIDAGHICVLAKALRSSLEAQERAEATRARYEERHTRMVFETLATPPNKGNIVSLFGVPIEQYAQFLDALTMLSPNDAARDVIDRLANTEQKLTAALIDKHRAEGERDQADAWGREQVAALTEKLEAAREIIRDWTLAPWTSPTGKKPDEPPCLSRDFWRYMMKRCHDFIGKAPTPEPEAGAKEKCPLCVTRMVHDCTPPKRLRCLDNGCTKFGHTESCYDQATPPKDAEAAGCLCDKSGDGHWLTPGNVCHGLNSQPGDRWKNFPKPRPQEGAR